MDTKLDRPIGTYFGRKPDVRKFQEEDSLPLSNKYIGIEIEAENVPHSLEDMGRKLFYWDVVSDGSLRNYGAEFVTKKLRGKDIVLALDELESFFKSNKINPDYTNRTSVHIHLDFRYLLFNQLKTLIPLYLIYEPLFFKFIGHNRDQNNYCVPFFRNPTGIKNLAEFFNPKSDPDNAIYNVVERAARYEAMNFKSLDKHGSIEFRHHFGTHDKVLLLPWIQALLYMAREAKSTTESEVFRLLETIPYPQLVAGINNYLRLDDLGNCEKLAKTSIATLLTYSVPST